MKTGIKTINLTVRKPVDPAERPDPEDLVRISISLTLDKSDARLPQIYDAFARILNISLDDAEKEELLAKFAAAVTADPL